MIGDIRNPWVRRPLVVVVFPLVVVWLVLHAVFTGYKIIFETVDEAFGDELRNAWEGPRKRG